LKERRISVEGKAGFREECVHVGGMDIKTLQLFKIQQKAHILKHENTTSMQLKKKIYSMILTT
jgi:hypothetical protein